MLLLSKINESASLYYSKVKGLLLKVKGSDHSIRIYNNAYFEILNDNLSYYNTNEKLKDYITTNFDYIKKLFKEDQ
jgi:hypothetical protein